jgi:hypothetical protein
VQLRRAALSCHELLTSSDKYLLILHRLHLVDTAMNEALAQEELEDLSRPFGRLVKTKLNVGANRNQAFIEFPDVNSAVNMVHHFMSSAEPAKVRSHPMRM